LTLALPAQAGATRLVLVRHAEADASMRGRCYGRLDVGLSPEGRRQARELGAALSDIPLAAVFSSPLARAVGTAASIAAPHDLEPVVEDGLREIDFGELEGLRYDEIEVERPELFREWMKAPGSVRFPGGEALADLRARVRPTVAAIRERHEGEAVSLVAHGGVIRVVLADVLGLADGALFRLGQAPGGLSVIDWVDGTPVVAVVNAVLYSRS
jgi:alpha-ribazole phosphatase